MINMVNLIDKWENKQGQSAPSTRTVGTLTQATVEINQFLDNTLFNMHQAGKIGAVCGNKHASKGIKRVLSKGMEYPFTSKDELDRILDPLLVPLGNRILISAGHFMPLKDNFSHVNQNSFKSLQSGLKMLEKLHKRNLQADLLITINDVTVNSIDEQLEELPTLSRQQRQQYYENFRLPLVYETEIGKTRAKIKSNFKVIVIGENKLSEKLSKDASKLSKKGLFLKSPGKNAYLLPFDVTPMVKLAHGNTEIGNFYDIHSPVLISNQKGLTGRPKCVRACARLAAIPYELNYTGFVQFLPICSRNAIEGFLIGREIYKRQYSWDMPYISIHDVLSCF